MVSVTEQVKTDGVTSTQRYENYGKRLENIELILNECDAIRSSLKNIVDSYRGYFDTAVKHIEEGEVEKEGEFYRQKALFQDFLDSLKDLENDELFLKFKNIKSGYAESSDITESVYAFLDIFEDECVAQRDNTLKLKEGVGGSIGLLHSFQEAFNGVVGVRSSLRDRVSSSKVDLLQNSEIDELRGQVEFLTSMVLELQGKVDLVQVDEVEGGTYLDVTHFQDFEDEQRDAINIGDSLLSSIVSSLYPCGEVVSHESVSLYTPDFLFDKGRTVITLTRDDISAQHMQNEIQSTKEEYCYNDQEKKLFLPLIFQGEVFSLLIISGVGAPQKVDIGERLSVLSDALFSRFARESLQEKSVSVNALKNVSVYKERKENFEKIKNDPDLFLHYISNDGENHKLKQNRSLMDPDAMRVFKGKPGDSTTGTAKNLMQSRAEIYLKEGLDDLARPHQLVSSAISLVKDLEDNNGELLKLLLLELEEEEQKSSRLRRGESVEILSDFSRFKNRLAAKLSLVADPKKKQSIENELHDKFVLVRAMSDFNIDFQEVKELAFSRGEHFDCMRKFLLNLETEVKAFLDRHPEGEGLTVGDMEDWNVFVDAYNNAELDYFKNIYNAVEGLGFSNNYELLRNSAYWLLTGRNPDRPLSPLFVETLDELVNNAYANTPIFKDGQEKIFESMLGALEELLLDKTIEGAEKIALPYLKTVRDVKVFLLKHGPIIGDNQATILMNLYHNMGRNQVLLFGLEVKSPHYPYKIRPMMRDKPQDIPWIQNERGMALFVQALMDKESQKATEVINMARECIFHFESHEAYHAFMLQNIKDVEVVLQKKDGYGSMYEIQVIIGDLRALNKHVNTTMVNNKKPTQVIINPADVNLFQDKDQAEEFDILCHTSGQDSGVILGGWELWEGVKKAKGVFS